MTQREFFAGSLDRYAGTRQDTGRIRKSDGP